jgi:hypothetical protein
MGKAARKEVDKPKKAAGAKPAEPAPAPTPTPAPAPILSASTARRFGVQMLSMVCMLIALRTGLLSPPPAQVKPVPRRPTGMHFSKTLSLGHAAPFVLERPLGLPAWDTAVLASELHTLTGVLTSPEPEFGPSFDASRPLAGLTSQMRPRHKYSEANMTARQFFARASNSHHQYSRNVSVDVSPRLRSQIEYLEQEIVAIYPQASAVTLDLDREDALTPCHTLAEHTIVTLADGAKQFLLLPPDRAAVLRFFPHLHPSAGWCRSPLRRISDSQLAGAQAMQVTLAPGELLYIPPLWIVEAMAERASIGVVGRVQSEAQRVAAAIRAVQRPRLAGSATEGNTGGEGGGGGGPFGWLRRAAGAAHPTDVQPLSDPPEASGELHAAGTAAWLIDELSARALGARAGLGAVVYCSRYQWLVQEGELPDPGAEGAGQELLPPPLCAARDAVAEASGGDRAQWEGYLSQVEGVLAAGARVDEGAKPTLLADLAEEIAAEAVPLGELPAFWRELYACARAAPPDEAALWVPRC